MASDSVSLTLALDVGVWSASHPSRFAAWKETRYQFYMVDLDRRGKFRFHLDSIPGPSSPCESLYRLRCPRLTLTLWNVL